MKKIWSGWLREPVFLYCFLYTVITISNSIGYLRSGIYFDPNGNWHEIDRALIVLIGVLAYEMAVKLPVRNAWLRVAAAYAPTLALCFLLVWLSGFREPLAPSAYGDIFVNYTGLFFLLSAAVILLERRRGRK